MLSHPLTSSYRAAFAFATRDAKASGSDTASSAKIFLLRLILAFLRPYIKRE